MGDKLWQAKVSKEIDGKATFHLCNFHLYIYKYMICSVTPGRSGAVSSKTSRRMRIMHFAACSKQLSPEKHRNSDVKHLVND